jgi:hypothetical protein
MRRSPRASGAVEAGDKSMRQRKSGEMACKNQKSMLRFLYSPHQAGLGAALARQPAAKQEGKNFSFFSA